MDGTPTPWGKLPLEILPFSAPDKRTVLATVRFITISSRPSFLQDRQLGGMILDREGHLIEQIGKRFGYRHKY